VSITVGEVLVCRRELWIGIEVDAPIDVARFSMDHGYDLIPADDLTGEQLASVGIRSFERILGSNC
jgi:hypothetical protein